MTFEIKKKKERKERKEKFWYTQDLESWHRVENINTR